MKKIIFINIALLSCVIFCFAQKGSLPIDDSIEINFSTEGGFYQDEVEINITATRASIYYTLNGARPTRKSTPYGKPIIISKTTILRVLAYRSKKQASVAGQTYFIDEPETKFPVISIGITPAVLFDPTEGLFMKGTHAVDSLWMKPGANFWTRKEIKAHIDIFEDGERNVYSNLSGLRLFGGMSRLFPQKSLAIVARKRYGQKHFKYPIFGKKEGKKFKFLVLRNSGSDFKKAHFRDALMTKLVKKWDIETQAYEPAHVYINGKYWGIYNIREKVNRYFLADNTEVDKDSLDLMEHRMSRKRGSKKHYAKLLRFIKKKDLSVSENYYWVQKQMEVDNFINYQIAQIYFDNQDAGGNIKYWRPQTPNGRWRWILYDTDWGFGLHREKAYRHNSLRFFTEEDGPRWPNPPWSTLLLRKLLENPDFERQFVNRFADHLNASFSSYVVNHKIDKMYQHLLSEMPRHTKRWNLSYEQWQKHVRIMHTFAAERPKYMRMHLMDYFPTGKQQTLNIQTNKGGTLYINNTVEVRTKKMVAKYFENYPITIRAVADYGYRFSHWEGIEIAKGIRGFQLQLKERKYNIRAVFEPFIHPMTNKVIINEICPFNKKAGDWLELHNTTDETVKVEGWVLTDNKNEFILPEISISPHDYLIICKDSARFFKAFPTAYNVVSGLNFGLHKRKETLGLFSRTGAGVDSVSYNIPPTDSSFTLSFLLPSLDNSDPQNWQTLYNSGTPNAPNPYYVESRILYMQTQWLQIGLAIATILLCILLLFLRKKDML